MNSISVTITYRQLMDVADDSDVYLSPKQAKEFLDRWDTEFVKHMTNAAYDLMGRIVRDYRKEKECKQKLVDTRTEFSNVAHFILTLLDKQQLTKEDTDRLIDRFKRAKYCADDLTNYLQHEKE